MKKIIALLSIALISTSISFAKLTENNTSNIETLRNQGYSESALKIIDTVKTRSEDNYTPKFEKKIVGPYYRAKVYFDPTQEDDTFGEHQINYTNSWNGDETHYTSKKYQKQSQDIPNL